MSQGLRHARPAPACPNTMCLIPFKWANEERAQDKDKRCQSQYATNTRHAHATTKTRHAHATTSRHPLNTISRCSTRASLSLCSTRASLSSMRSTSLMRTHRHRSGNGARHSQDRHHTANTGTHSQHRHTQIHRHTSFSLLARNFLRINIWHFSVEHM